LPCALAVQDRIVVVQCVGVKYPEVRFRCGHAADGGCSGWNHASASGADLSYGQRAPYPSISRSTPIVDGPLYRSHMSATNGARRQQQSRLKPSASSGGVQVVTMFRAACGVGRRGQTSRPPAPTTLRAVEVQSCVGTLRGPRGDASITSCSTAPPVLAFGELLARDLRWRIATNGPAGPRLSREVGLRGRIWSAKLEYLYIDLCAPVRNYRRGKRFFYRQAWREA